MSTTAAESWDSDPDIVLPDGPLTLHQSDTEPEETDESSLSALFSTNGNQSLSSVSQDERDQDQDDQDGDRDQDTSDYSKEHTLKKKSASNLNRNSLPFLTPYDNPSLEDNHLTHSFSSNSSEYQQSTIKISSNRHPSQINHTVLAVLASGAKGTVTRLEPSKKPSPIQAGFDWDQDLVLPEGGLRAVTLRPSDRSGPRVSKKSSFASAISDELEDLNLASNRSAPTTHSHRPASKSNIQCATVDEEGVDMDVDFELPASSQTLNLNHWKNHARTANNGKPNSILRLDLDHLDHDNDLPKSSASSRRGSVLRTTGVPNSTSTSMSLSVANRSSTEDSNIQRIRTRPSLTPSLMSDRSSSSFPENEDDINEGFFDDIEFPPEFGIPNPLSGPSSSVEPIPTSSAHPPKSTPQPSEPKGKQSNKPKSVDLQSYLNSKIQARALMVERNNSSLSQQLRQNISTYEDRDDERVEDGLEIDNGSIHPANLRTRKTSSMSSTSSLAPQHSNRNSYFQQPHSHRFHQASSSTGSIVSQQSKSKRVPVQSSRSGLIYNHTESRTNSPVPSSSTSTLSRRQSAPQTAPLINRPQSTIPNSSRQHAAIIHRPISATGIIPQASASKNLAHGTSDSIPRLRTKSCQSTASDVEPIKKHLTHSLAPSGRVQSPLGPSSLGTNRTTTKTHQSSSLRTRVSTTAASSHGPPVLSASNQRTLKHKKSAAAIKSVASGSSDLRSAYSSVPSVVSPPGSMTSLSQRSLHRKQSMPSLNHSHHHSTGSTGLPGRFERAYQASAGPSSIWKSRSKSKQQFEYSSSPSSPTLLGGSAIPSYADPTRASMNRHGNSGTVSSQNEHLPGSTPGNSRRSSSESVRMNVTSPAPPPLTVINGVPLSGSRLTMPTIASRLKAKPSIIHEENSSTNNNSKRWKTTVIPQQLRRPRRQRLYGDGTELDEFDDLPTSKEKEKMFTRVAVGVHKNNYSTVKGSSKIGGGLVSNSEVSNHQHQQQQRNKSRLETRKAEGARRRALAINNSFQVKKNASKKGLIRQMSGNTLSKLSNNSEMRWNGSEARWEGNEHILREFDNALSTSSRPALISQLSIQSPIIRSHHQLQQQQQQHQQNFTNAEENTKEKRFSSSSFNHKVNKAQNHVVGGMIFDSESMSWKKVNGEDDEENLELEPDEELELRWLADDESSSLKKHDLNSRHSYYFNPPAGGGTNGGVGISSSWTSFSSAFSSLNHAPNHQHQREEHSDAEQEHGDSEETSCKKSKNNQFWKACQLAQERHNKEIKSWIPADLAHNHNNTHQNPHFELSGFHSYGRLSDKDRCYLQEIRKLVLEEEI